MDLFPCETKFNVYIYKLLVEQKKGEKLKLQRHVDNIDLLPNI